MYEYKGAAVAVAAAIGSHNIRFTRIYTHTQFANKRNQDKDKSIFIFVCVCINVSIGFCKFEMFADEWQQKQR